MKAFSIALLAAMRCCDAVAAEPSIAGTYEIIFCSSSCSFARAVSSLKRNIFAEVGFIVEGLGHEQFEGALPT